MSELNELLKNNEKRIPPEDENGGWIEYCILKMWQECDLEDDYISDKAAAELAALRERVKVLETVGRRMLNSLPVSEIEIAREALGSTNTRIILVARDELAAALRGEA